MKTTQEMIEVMQAFCDGKAVECRPYWGSMPSWLSVKSPEWDWDKFDYRISEPAVKPEPQPADPEAIAQRAAEIVMERMKKDADPDPYGGRDPFFRLDKFWNYAAIDHDGRVSVFNQSPLKSESESRWAPNAESSAMCAFHLPPPSDWAKTLRKRGEV